MIKSITDGGLLTESGYSGPSVGVRRKGERSMSTTTTIGVRQNFATHHTTVVLPWNADNVWWLDIMYIAQLNAWRCTSEELCVPRQHRYQGIS